LGVGGGVGVVSVRLIFAWATRDGGGAGGF